MKGRAAENLHRSAVTNDVSKTSTHVVIIGRAKGKGFSERTDLTTVSRHPHLEYQHSTTIIQVSSRTLKCAFGAQGEIRQLSVNRAQWSRRQCVLQRCGDIMDFCP